jgi:hypothetical protein
MAQPHTAQPAKLPGFENNTRLRKKYLATQTRPTGGGLSSPVLTVSKVGLLKGIHLHISGTISSGGLSALNALGKASIIKRVTVRVNNGNVLFSVSGPGYHWLLRDNLDGYYNPFPGSDARSAVATGAYDVSMYIPLMLNEHDAKGLIMLQNEGTQLTVEIDWESDANIATGISSMTGNAVPTLEFFQLPKSEADWPNIFLLHSIIEDQLVISATSGDQTYAWPKGNVYLAMYHGYGFGVSGADSWTRAALRANQTDYLEDWLPAYADYKWANDHPTTRPAGTFNFDLIGSSGLGAFGGARDQIDSAYAAEIQTVVTVNAAKTLYAIRRMLIPATYP